MFVFDFFFQWSFTDRRSDLPHPLAPLVICKTSTGYVGMADYKKRGWKNSDKKKTRIARKKVELIKIKKKKLNRMKKKNCNLIKTN